MSTELKKLQCLASCPPLQHFHHPRHQSLSRILLPVPVRLPGLIPSYALLPPKNTTSYNAMFSQPTQKCHRWPYGQLGEKAATPAALQGGRRKPAWAAARQQFLLTLSVQSPNLQTGEILAFSNLLWSLLSALTFLKDWAISKSSFSSTFFHLPSPWQVRDAHAAFATSLPQTCC